MAVFQHFVSIRENDGFIGDFERFRNALWHGDDPENPKHPLLDTLNLEEEADGDGPYWCQYFETYEPLERIEEEFIEQWPTVITWTLNVQGRLFTSNLAIV
jgi:hypothetical protein